MKKVLALVLAVMMVSTTAFAAYKTSTISPASSVKISEAGFVGNPGISEANVSATIAGAKNVKYLADATGTVVNTITRKSAEDEAQDSGVTDNSSVAKIYAERYTETQLEQMRDDLNAEKTDLLEKIDKATKDKDDRTKKQLQTELNEVKDELQAVNGALAIAGGAASTSNSVTNINSLGDMIFRSITNENYAVSSVKVVTGKAYVKGVEIVDKDEQVKVNFVDDLDNVTPKDFDLSFTLKGKGKMIIRNLAELRRYDEMVGGTTKKVKDTATLPSVKVQMSGSVCYGKVTVKIGLYTDEDLDGLEGRPTLAGNGKDISLEDDVIKFDRGLAIGDVTRSAQAGAYVADAILTEDYDEGLTLEARVYSGDTLYLYVDHAPHPVVDMIDTGDGDVDFYFFHENTKYTTLNTNARLIFNETEEGDHVYSYKNGKLTEVGVYDEDEGCMVVKARTLGQYITSDTELSWLDIAGSDDVVNPDTGANDVVGIAAALAAVALVSAAAVTLKK